MERGFVPLERGEQRTAKKVVVDDDDDSKQWTAESECTAEWDDDGIIEELWLWIFECLSAAEVFRAQKVCRKWKAVIAKYNVAEREEMGCYLSKCRLTER